MVSMSINQTTVCISFQSGLDVPGADGQIYKQGLETGADIPLYSYRIYQYIISP